MIRLRLRLVVGVSFSKSEETNFDELYYSREHGALLRSLDAQDVICMVSRMATQLVFVHGYTEAKTSGEQPWVLLYSQRVRVKRGPGLSNAIDPKMLGSYARQVGIELVGLKLFEEYHKHLTQ